MMRSVFLFILMFIYLGVFSASAQNDSISYSTDLYYLGASESFQPHWQVSNRYGIFDRLRKTEFVGLFGLAYKHDFNKKFKMETEVEYNLRSNISSSYFQQLYFNFYYGSLQLKIGKEEYTIGQYSEELSSGSLFVSNNSRPPPRVGIGFYNYTPVPFIERYLELKAMMNFGILNDDRSDILGTINPWYHEKYFYLRSKSLPVNVHAGLNHSVIFGGSYWDGEKIETDLFASFFGRGSSKLGGGEETNAAGGHFGLYDFGLNWRVKKSEFQMYCQIPFSDGSGKKFQSSDRVLGLLFKRNKNKLISSAIYEYINTMDQSGSGIPDPYVNGKIVIPYLIEDFDKFMLDNFDTIVTNTSSGEFIKYLSNKFNYGHEFNGRDNYYNNGIYRKGQSYNNYAIGSSLILSQREVKEINPNFDESYDLYFVSNRIIGHHLAFEGYFGKIFLYRTKITFSKNYGSYAGANAGIQNWASIEDQEYYNSYYFKDGLKQAYTFFELNYSPFKNKGASFTSSIAYDFGEMYDNFGVLFGFHYNGFFSLKKTKKD